jgi:hypothetical protein
MITGVVNNNYKYANPNIYSNNNSKNCISSIISNNKKPGNFDRLEIDYSPREEVDCTADSSDGISKCQAAEVEARRKLAAMKIAMRLAGGDVVPHQDRQFLMKYDAKLYRAVMRARDAVTNTDPKAYDSEADKLKKYEERLENTRKQAALNISGVIESQTDEDDDDVKNDDEEE